MTCRIWKARKPLPESFVYMCVHQSGGKTLAILLVKLKSNREVPKYLKKDTNEYLDAWIFQIY